MSSFRLRPRFQYVTELTATELEQRMKELLSQQNAPCVGTVVKDFIVLKILPKEQHFWSPQLTLMLESHEKGTLIRGLYAPNPTVWTMFMFGYIAIATIALFISMYGLSQWMLEMDATILWSLPVLCGIGLALYLIAQTGQKVGAEQMFTLHHVLEQVVGQRIHIN